VAATPRVTASSGDSLDDRSSARTDPADRLDLDDVARARPAASVRFGRGHRRRGVWARLALAGRRTFLTLTLGGHLSRLYAGLDAAVWLLVGLAAWRVVRREAVVPSADRDARPALDTLDWCVRAAFVAVALAALAVPVIEYWSSPNGQWDAWAIWNQKARFMSRAGPAGRRRLP
jgi:hypothetical protein